MTLYRYPLVKQLSRHVLCTLAQYGEHRAKWMTWVKVKILLKRKKKVQIVIVACCHILIYLIHTDWSTKSPLEVLFQHRDSVSQSGFTLAFSGARWSSKEIWLKTVSSVCPERRMQKQKISQGYSNSRLQEVASVS